MGHCPAVGSSVNRQILTVLDICFHGVTGILLHCSQLRPGPHELLMRPIDKVFACLGDQETNHGISVFLKTWELSRMARFTWGTYPEKF